MLASAPSRLSCRSPSWLRSGARPAVAPDLASDGPERPVTALGACSATVLERRRRRGRPERKQSGFRPPPSGARPAVAPDHASAALSAPSRRSAPVPRRFERRRRRGRPERKQSGFRPPPSGARPAVAPDHASAALSAPSRRSAPVPRRFERRRRRGRPERSPGRPLALASIPLLAHSTATSARSVFALCSWSLEQPLVLGSTFAFLSQAGPHCRLVPASEPGLVRARYRARIVYGTGHYTRQ